MIGKLSILTALIFLVIGIANVGAYTYQVPFYTFNDTPSPLRVYGLGMNTTKSCKTQLEAISSLSGADFSATSTFYSPDGVNIGSLSLTHQNSFTCRTLGNPSTTSSLNNIYEGYVYLLHTATAGNTTLTTTHSCTTSDYYFNISVNTTAYADSYGSVPNRFGEDLNTLVSNSSVLDNIYKSNYYNCESDVKPSSYITDSGSTTLVVNLDDEIVLYYPFNSSAGKIIYSFNSTQPVVQCAEVCVSTAIIGEAYLFLVDVEEETSVLLHSNTVNCAGSASIAGRYSGILPALEKDKLYAFVYILRFDDDHLACGGASRSYTLREPETFDIDVFVYRPVEWVCTDWSDCIGGLKTRTCTDPDGIADPEIESEICEIIELENYTLGFEDYYTENFVHRCYADWQITTGCFYLMENVSVDRPKDWIVVDPAIGKQYFLSMTSEWATEGTRSVKLWFIPPKDGEPTDPTNPVPAFRCGNISTGKIPQIYRGINDSFFISKNITFPATNMMLTFDTKKCDEQVRQHYGLQTLFGIQLCPEQCYAQNCSTEPLGRYYFNIIDTNTSQSLLVNPYFDTATADTETMQFDLSDLGIITGRIYNIVFAVYPENLHDTRGNCVMFDNVRYAVTQTPISELLPECKSTCIGYDYYEAILLSNGKCLPIIHENHPNCLPAKLKEAREKREPYCFDNVTLYFYNNKTAKYDSVTCEFGCKDGKCLTEEEAEEIEEKERTITPITGAEIVQGTQNLLATPSFFSLIISGMIGALVTRFVNKYTETGGWIIGFIMFIGILGVFSFTQMPNGGTYFPTWYYIALIVISGLIFATMFRERIFGR